MSQEVQNLYEQGTVKFLMEKWDAILNADDVPVIKDLHKRAVTAVMLENQLNAGGWEADVMNRGGLLTEFTGPPTNNISGGNVATFDPIMMSLVRRSLPNLMHYDFAGVQPMTGPTGLIFAMRSRYDSMTGTEAFFNEANTEFSGWSSSGSFAPVAADVATNPVANVADSTLYNSGRAMLTAYAESLGDDSGANNFNSMGFSVEKITVTAKSRALKTDYTIELAQDLKAIHGLDAETELSNILTTEILTELNREMVRLVYYTAVAGAQYRTAVPGVYNLDTDSNGRWSIERIKGLIMQMGFEANGIYKDTRRGKGNLAIVSSDVATALAMTGLLSNTPKYDGDRLNTDESTNTYCGMIGDMKIFMDPYFGGIASGLDLAVIGYKGAHPWDSGLFYCPYVPLQMFRAIDPKTFQPKIGFKTRYGLVANPFAEGTTQGLGAINARSNKYYRIFAIQNLQ